MRDNQETDRLFMEDLLLSQMNDNLELLISQTNTGILGELPDDPALYFVTTDHRKREHGHERFSGLPYVMYVGMTTNLMNRWNTHQLRKLLRVGFELKWKPPNESFLSLTHEEAMYISILQPPLNVQGWPNTPEDKNDFMRNLEERTSRWNTNGTS